MSLLLLGDVHYYWTKDDKSLDQKDARVKSLASNQITDLQRVIRDIADRFDSPTKLLAPSAMLICGDLACLGNRREYVESVRVLVEALNLSGRDADTIHVVPGNHDIHRKDCTAKTKMNPKKFAPLREAWATKYEDILAIDEVRKSQIESDNCTLNLYSLNSCVGCGEWRMFPPTIQKEMEAVVEKCRTSDRKIGFELEGERLDTPMFELEHIEELKSHIFASSHEHVPVILAHHNLLPQELPRLEMYTELINSGQFRSSLVRCNRPIVYCHGHIHTDPIEIISDGKLDSSQLICVSAPQLVEGYNELQFHFSSEGDPMGMTVACYRVASNGLVELSVEHRITFVNSGSFLNEKTHRLRDLLTDELGRFRELKKTYDESSASTSETTEAEFADILLEAEWKGIAEIENKRLSSKNWNIRRRAR